MTTVYEVPFLQLLVQNLLAVVNSRLQPKLKRVTYRTFYKLFSTCDVPPAMLPPDMLGESGISVESVRVSVSPYLSVSVCLSVWPKKLTKKLLVRY